VNAATQTCSVLVPSSELICRVPAPNLPAAAALPTTRAAAHPIRASIFCAIE
jgi:hypothetical protein